MLSYRISKQLTDCFTGVLSEEMVVAYVPNEALQVRADMDCNLLFFVAVGVHVCCFLVLCIKNNLRIWAAR